MTFYNATTTEGNNLGSTKIGTYKNMSLEEFKSEVKKATASGVVIEEVIQDDNYSLVSIKEIYRS